MCNNLYHVRIGCGRGPDKIQLRRTWPVVLYYKWQLWGGSIVVHIHCLGRSGLSDNVLLGTDMQPPSPKQEQDTQIYRCFASFCVVVLHLLVVLYLVVVVMSIWGKLVSTLVILHLFEVVLHLFVVILCLFAVPLHLFGVIFLVSTSIWVTFCRWLPRAHTSGLWACGW